MALHEDLLEQADHLATREPRRPRQASLRRVVSSAYYALFHLLVYEGAPRLAPSQPLLLRPRVRRGFSHGIMKEACQRFKRIDRNPSDDLRPLLALPIEQDLITVAEARHEADYDLAATFSRTDVLYQAAHARSAFSSWKAVRSRPNATVFIAALLRQRQWR